MTGVDHPTCEYCGADLCGRGITSMDGTRVIRWGVDTCYCEEAVAERSRSQADAFDRMMREAQGDDMKRTSDREQRITRAGIPKHFRSAQVAGDVMVRYVSAFDDDTRLGLYLIGPVGVGKSYAASAVAVALCDKGYRVGYATTLGMLNEIKATYSGDGDESTVLRWFEGVPLLVLDDLGKEPPKEWALSILWTVINARYESDSPTIITTQYDDAALVKRLAAHGDTQTAEAIVSRLRELCYRVEMTGSDRRGEDR